MVVKGLTENRKQFGPKIQNSSAALNETPAIMGKHCIVSHKNMNLPCFRLPCTPMSKYDSFLSKIAVRLGALQSTLISSPQTTKSILNLYTLTSVSKFCILFSIHFLGYWQGEFVLQSRVSLVSWYFLFFSWS